MLKFQLFSLILQVILWTSSTLSYPNPLETEHYCEISEMHTMCRFPTSEPSKRCTGPIRSGLSESEKKTILNLHNELRQKVKRGKERRGDPGPQPKAMKMSLLEWDEELATIAQRWASQCDYGHDEGARRKTGRFEVGQNIAIKGTTGNINYSAKVDSMVHNWYDEVRDFDKNVVQNYRFSRKTGHYTQMVWADTTKIGCGAMRYKDGEWKKLYLVCNYGPAGNVPGETVY